MVSATPYSQGSVLEAAPVWESQGGCIVHSKDSRVKKLLAAQVQSESQPQSWPPNNLLQQVFQVHKVWGKEQSFIDDKG